MINEYPVGINNSFKLFILFIRFPLFLDLSYFQIIGLALLGIGAYSKYEYGQILSISESNFTSIPALLMILGVFVFILGFLGCFGAFRENRFLLVIVSLTTFINPQEFDDYINICIIIQCL